MLNIKDIFKRFTINKTSSIGLYFCIISIFTPVVYTLVSSHLSNSGLIIISPFQELFNFIPTLGLFLLPLGIAIISIGLSLHSQDMATDSDNKINSIANANFRGIIGQIEDKRIELKENELTLDPSTGNLLFISKLVTKREIYTWKCLTYIDEAFDILETSTIKHRNLRRFLNLINNYVFQIIPFRKEFSVEEVIHIISMYNRIYSLETMLENNSLDRCKFRERKEESIDFIRTITGIGNNIVIDSDFVQKYKSILSSFIEQGLDQQAQNNLRWNLLFVRVNDIFNYQYESLKKNRVKR